jgi:RHS repeat-associated protein
MTAATYDGGGQRATATTSAGTQQFLWGTVVADNPQLLMDSQNAYIYAGATAPAEQVNLATGAVTYLLADSLGSVRATISPAGALTATASYDAWGNPQTAGGLTADTPFGYAGGYTDPTGLIYLINRYYDPATGQSTSVDPALAQTSAPYAYAGGNPVTNTDPTGRSTVLSNSELCQAVVSTGGWHGEICVLTRVGQVLTENILYWGEVFYQVRSGPIWDAGFASLGLTACANTGPFPGYPVNCSHNNAVVNHGGVFCGQSTCRILTQEYVSRRVNWLQPWVVGAWMNWGNNGGQHLGRTVSLTGPLKEDGNCGGGFC